MTQFKDYDIGCIVGRYQIANLHDAHKDIIKEVIDRHKRTIIFVGCSPTSGTKEHPLDYPARKSMIQEHFPGVMIAPLMDTRRDDIWSETLDTKIREIFPHGKVCLYGGRDSFLRYYTGRFDSREFPAADYRPATEIREEIGREVADSVDFRKGIIYSTQNQFPRVYCCVDVAVLNDKGQVLLGRKPNEERWRFPGGFVDQNETLESASRREVHEETGCEIDNIQYICSQVIEDWRYASTSDALMTSFFCGYYTFGAGKAGDDLAETQWFKLESFRDGDMVDNHVNLLKELKRYINKGEKK